MRHVILAGGLSTRLPYKCLLTVSPGRNALDRLVGQLASKDLTIVVRFGSLVHHYCLLNKWPVTLQMGEGLSGALTSGGPGIFWCVDNVYEDKDIWLSEQRMEDSCVTRYVMGRKQLAFWDDPSKMWVRDGRSTGKALTTPWHLSAASMANIPRGMDQAHEIFNRLRIQPVSSQGPWHDIGTPESYVAYCEERWSSSVDALASTQEAIRIHQGHER